MSLCCRFLIPTAETPTRRSHLYFYLQGQGPELTSGTATGATSATPTGGGGCASTASTTSRVRRDICSERCRVTGLVRREREAVGGGGEGAREGDEGGTG